MPNDRDVPADVYLPEVFSEAEWRAGSRGNWFWLIDLPSHTCAVELSHGAPTNDELLKARFETVRHFDLRSAGALPLPILDASLDCVLLHSAWLGSSPPNVKALLRECGRCLRPGGCLVFLLDHRLSVGRSPVARWLPRLVLGAPAALFRRWTRYRSREESAPWPLHVMTRELQVAGFGEVRTYYAFPTIDAPHQLLPARAHAVALNEAHQASGGMRSLLRRSIRSAGLESALFPGFLLIAVR